MKVNDPSFLKDNPWLGELKKRGRDSTPVNNININNKELTPVNKNNRINNNNRGIYNINNINNKSLSDRRLSDRYNKNNIIIYNNSRFLEFLKNYSGPSRIDFRVPIEIKILYMLLDDDSQSSFNRGFL